MHAAMRMGHSSAVRAWNCRMSTSGSSPGASGGGVSGNVSPPKGLTNQLPVPAGLSRGLFKSGVMPCVGCAPWSPHDHSDHSSHSHGWLMI